jgi:hypothetical protein
MTGAGGQGDDQRTFARRPGWDRIHDHHPDGQRGDLRIL